MPRTTGLGFMFALSPDVGRRPARVGPSQARGNAASRGITQRADLAWRRRARARHHGSCSSSREEFVTAAHAPFTVACAGPGEPLRFPAAAVERRRAAGSTARAGPEREPVRSLSCPSGELPPRRVDTSLDTVALWPKQP